ncbi:MAG: cysteine-rich KTR domain-containing protein [Defluviitaleaceae bacterium]|nr:cysteine-rich KTR domain-containing protein [Defluviitaleaceae bacterium]
MITTEWLICPICDIKARRKMRVDTIFVNFPILCPKCKKETLVNVQRLNITIIAETTATVQKPIMYG